MRNSDKTALKTVKVKRERLKEQLATNKESHQRAYEEAMSGYAKKRGELALTLAKAAQAFADEQTDSRETALSEAFQKVSYQDKPENHTREYERAIQLADWEVADEIELSVHDFNCYILDEWSWRDAFAASVLRNSG